MQICIFYIPGGKIRGKCKLSRLKLRPAIQFAIKSIYLPLWMSAWVICFLWNWPFLIHSLYLFIPIFLGEEVFSVVQLLLVSMNCSKGSLIMLKGVSNMLQTFERDARFYLNAILSLFVHFISLYSSFFLL